MKQRTHLPFRHNPWRAAALSCSESVRALLIPAAIAACCLLTGCPRPAASNKTAPPSEEQPRIQDLRPVPFSEKDTKTSFVSPDDHLEVVYMDLGDDVGMVLRAPSNALIVANVKGDGVPDPRGDRVYGVDLDENKVCVFELGSDNGSGGLGQATASSANGGARRNPSGSTGYEIAFRVPRKELLGENGQGLIVVETFDPGMAAPGKRFPGALEARAAANPFQRSFRLLRATTPEDGISDAWPEGLPVTPHVIRTTLGFRASPAKVFLGEKARLSWELPPDAVAVDLQPGFGDVKSPQDVSPDGTQTYTLRVKRPNGQWQQESVKVEVRNVQIAAFEVRPAKVKYGDTFSISWDVRGAKDIKLTPPGSLQTSTMNRLGSANIRNQSRLSLSATQTDFPSPGSYTFSLSAEGPGGEATAKAVLQILK